MLKYFIVVTLVLLHNRNQCQSGFSLITIANEIPLLFLCTSGLTVAYNKVEVEFKSAS